MIICLLAFHIHTGRLLTFACLFFLLLLQSSVALTISTAPTAIETIQIDWNTTFASEQTYNLTQTLTTTCVAEVLDVTLPYFSLPYRIFAGALIVPITFCAISGNILVIYVIKHFHALRITGNVFLASLAVADVGVSTLAMTFYGLQLLQGRWILGAVSE
jgi:7 transmembrane receptor (rhodopsin family)